MLLPVTRPYRNCKKTSEIDSVIYTNKSFHIENVKRDENKWKKEIHPELIFILNLGVEAFHIKQINFFLAKISILYPLKTPEKHLLRRLSGGINLNIGQKWVKSSLIGTKQ